MYVLLRGRLASCADIWAKHYGVLFAESLGDKFGPLPLKESLPRLPPPLDESLLFYAQVDEMTELSRGKEWSWCDVRPDMVVSLIDGRAPPARLLIENQNIL